MPAGPAYLRGDERGTVAARAAVNTTICGCAGALTALLLAWLRTRTYEVRTCCNGVLGGMVAITALAPFVDPWCAAGVLPEWVPDSFGPM